MGEGGEMTLPALFCWRCKQEMKIHSGLSVMVLVSNLQAEGGASCIEFPHPFCKKCVKSFRRWVNRGKAVR